MARKRVKKSIEYYVTGIGYGVGGQIFQKQHPPASYGLDFKQWQQRFNRVIDDIHACQESAKSWVIRKIYRTFVEPEFKKDKHGKKTKEQVHPQEPNYRHELIQALNSQEWMNYPLLHRWVRDAYHRGHSWVDNQICVGTGNGATVKRVSRNVVAVEICGNPMTPKRYEKIQLLFNVGRVTPKGNLRIIFRDETGTVELHYSKLVQRVEPTGTGAIGLDKGFTEALTDSNGAVYGNGIGKVMNRARQKRHIRGRARNHLWQLAQKKPHIYRCNLGKKRWTEYENRKKRTLTTMVRTGVNQVFDQYEATIAEDLSAQIKGKKRSKKRNRQLSEWCKGTLQTALEEISYRRKSSVTVVNAAYTSQVDHRNGTLLGYRNGDSFFTFDGVVLQANCNAASNIEARIDDKEITRFMKWGNVQRVLVERTASFLAAMGLTLEDAANRGWLDRKHFKGQSASTGTGKSRSQEA